MGAGQAILASRRSGTLYTLDPRCSRVARYIGDNGLNDTGIIQHGSVQDLPGDPDILALLQGPERMSAATSWSVPAGQQRRPIADATFAVPVQPRAMRDFLVFDGAHRRDEEERAR